MSSRPFVPQVPSSAPLPPASASAPPATRGAAMRGVSASMQTLYREIGRVAHTAATVLVLGETGTGKELVARALHAQSTRGAGPFVAVNCGAIAPGLIEAELFGHERGSFTGAVQQHAGHFERAASGTLFLDEISEMPLDMQVRLLRVLETRRFHRVGGSELVETDARVVAASNRDLMQAVRDGTFREDLLYRLAVFPIRVPSLRERGDDVVVLAEHFVDELNHRAPRSKHLSRASLAVLRAQRWSGNVRELKNAIHRAYILSPDVIDMSLALRPTPELRPRRIGDRLVLSVGTSLDVAQREIILATLDFYGGDKPRAARALGVSLKTLYNRLELYRDRH